MPLALSAGPPNGRGASAPHASAPSRSALRRLVAELEGLPSAAARAHWRWRGVIGEGVREQALTGARQRATAEAANLPSARCGASTLRTPACALREAHTCSGPPQGLRARCSVAGTCGKRKGAVSPGRGAGMSGSPSRARTCDTRINSPLLYQLSYRGTPLREIRQRAFACKNPGDVEARAGIEPTSRDLQSPAWPLCHRAPLARRIGGRAKAVNAVARDPFGASGATRRNRL